ncbi:MAG: hypothetical protein ACRET0_15140 [Steroidobacteraceae bacterium]
MDAALPAKSESHRQHIFPVLTEQEIGRWQRFGSMARQLSQPSG